MGKGGLKLKKIRTGLLGILAFVAVFPVAFLVIGSFMGKTEGEKNYAAFINPSYNPRFYTQNWYLAHIIPVNGESFYRFENKNINDINEIKKEIITFVPVSNEYINNLFN